MQLEKKPPLSFAVDKDFELIFFIHEGVRLYTIEESQFYPICGCSAD